MDHHSTLLPVTGTKRQILEQLKRQGPTEALALADALHLTDMAIRQHLHALQEQGLVDYREERRARGRPAKLWRPTAAADAHFPDAHADLTLQLLDTLQEGFGDDGMQTLLAARRTKLTTAYGKRLPAGTPLPTRLHELAAIRSAEGYMAEVQPQPDGSYLFIENHCPICVAATACRGLCQVELAVFRSVLGPDTHVERLDHILAGARRCAYRVCPQPHRTD